MVNVGKYASPMNGMGAIIMPELVCSHYVVDFMYILETAINVMKFHCP